MLKYVMKKTIAKETISSGDAEGACYGRGKDFKAE